MPRPNPWEGVIPLDLIVSTFLSGSYHGLRKHSLATSTSHSYLHHAQSLNLCYIKTPTQQHQPYWPLGVSNSILMSL
jgi:hypothetical protein